jgi:diguanylate cyclase (GGDEF)-like protein
VLDITERKLNEERLRLIAYYDDLTNVYRRHVLMDQIDMLIHNHDLAILFLDLDKFKEVNDRYGHSVGDRFLKAFVRLIREILLPDYVFGRLAGDEFVIILPNYSEESVKALIENIRKQMSYLKIEDYEHHISVSIGVSYSDKDGDNSSALISVADKNMYEEKAKKWSK